MQKITLHTEKIFTKLVNMKNIHVLQTAQPSRLFYFNNELRLEHNTVERKTNQNIYITDEKLKRRFHRKRKVYFNGSSSPVSDTFIPRRNQKSS
jgi:hypothetical protein